MTRQQLIDVIFSRKTFLCIGLDSDITLVPPHLKQKKNPLFIFNRELIEATANTCIGFKINTAFYEAIGSDGWKMMEMTVKFLKENYPKHFIIADAKRGDIGNTSRYYAEAFFKHIPFDAVTVNPYMGYDSIQPFLEYSNKWVIVLALTSNAGSADFQLSNLPETGSSLYMKVIQTSLQWGNKDNTMYVIGGTNPDGIKKVREVIPDHFILVPGIGAQGGKIADVVNNGLTKECCVIINISRSIIYAGNGKDYATKASYAANKIQKAMESTLKKIKTTLG